MYVITPEFQKNHSICFKSSNLAFKGQKVVLPLFALLIPSYSAEIRYRTFIWHIAWHSRRLSSKWNLIGLPPHVQCVVVFRYVLFWWVGNRQTTSLAHYTLWSLQSFPMYFLYQIQAFGPSSWENNGRCVSRVFPRVHSIVDIDLNTLYCCWVDTIANNTLSNSIW